MITITAVYGVNLIVHSNIRPMPTDNKPIRVENVTTDVKEVEEVLPAVVIIANYANSTS